MYAQPMAVEQTTAHPQRSSKMKMASLMAVVDDSDMQSPVAEAAQKNKRVKTDDWEERTVPISISNLTAASEPVGPGPLSGTGTGSRFSIADDVRPAPNASSLFHEMPSMIQSFAEEKRREGGERKNGVATNGDSSPPATAKSIYEFYFPTAKADANGAPSGRSLKRKRRSGRRGDDQSASDLDVLRFGVDAANLVPQGLVDRVDVHMSRAVLVRVVGNHVANWCNRAGFAPSFDQEIMTVLATYYPCGYPTLLDEVLAGFMFKRPEFIDLLLPPMLEKMLEKMQKAGESVSTTKYPVANALARILF
ncbi:hypothetical protein BBJ29_001310 [Phytophthora kernoviae]|uniref:Uncharacterized protein n=1 Tax=Phytophthora kernoviae TaxID=325452 RepID=A0A3F2RZG0_9STRA|nr:hypothetical protein BBP00_00001771 [Phytophthora kernoviae]RLN69644.1 hypothetical protein BBJ29_001310 [Phytophthora kernoviae]